jgi:Protein of unknown function (DUF1579)
MKEMPRPGEPHARLARLAGEWVGDETLSPSPWGPGGPATGRMTSRLDVDGFFLVQDYVEEKEDCVVYRGHGVVGWDAKRNAYAWYWVDSMGEVPPAPTPGTWDADALVFTNDKQARYTFRLAGDVLVFTIDGSRDEGKTWQRFMEGTYRRTAARPQP